MGVGAGGRKGVGGGGGWGGGVKIAETRNLSDP